MKSLRSYEIVQYVKERKYCSLAELMEKFHVSSATIHRDVAALVNAGQVRKVHGGVAAAENVSASILAERPMLAPYIPQMKENIARALGIGEDAVGIAAGTNEGLGYIGRGEGITVVANVLLRGI